MPLEIVKEVAETERLQCDIEFIDIYKDRLFTTSDGGKVKIWKTDDLQAVGELDAQQGHVCCIATFGNKLYAGTSGGNIVVWDIEKSVVVKELNHHEGSVMKLRVSGDCVVSGDSEGKVLVWQDEQLSQQYETCEEVWDMDLTDDLLYSVRDRDLVVQKIQKSQRGNRLNIIKVVEGRSPMCRMDGKIAILSRNGIDILILHDDQAQFKRIGTIQGQDRMINALACIPASPDNSQQPKARLYSGGWDSTFRSYCLETFTPLSRLELGQAINCIRPDPSNSGYLFVGGNNGLLCKILDR